MTLMFKKKSDQKKRIYPKRKGFILEEKYFDIQKKRIYSIRKVTKRKEKKIISTHPLFPHYSVFSFIQGKTVSLKTLKESFSWILPKS